MFIYFSKLYPISYNFSFKNYNLSNRSYIFFTSIISELIISIVHHRRWKKNFHFFHESLPPFLNLWNWFPSIRYTHTRYLSRVMRVYAGARSISKGLRNFIHRIQSLSEQWSSMRTIFQSREQCSISSCGEY